MPFIIHTIRSTRWFHILIVVSFTFSAGLLTVAADSLALNMESYNLGTINGQDGWSSLGAAGSGCALYDHTVVTNTYGYANFGSKSLRISNAVTSGCFGDQTYSKPSINEAGETSAQGLGPGGTRQTYFEGQFDFASTVPGAQQPGLIVSVSPDRGDGTRMSYLRIEDQAGGFAIYFDDYQHVAANFVETQIVSNLSRTIPHTLKFAMKFYDGIANDVVQIYLDGVLKIIGTSWEDYFRDVAGTPPGTIKRLLFRTGGTAAPATSGNGLLFDNIQLFSGAGPVVIASATGPSFPTPPPVPLCSLIGGGTNPIVRADVPGGTITNGTVFCRVLAQSGKIVTRAEEIGNQAVLSRGVLQAVDVFGLLTNGTSVARFNNPVKVCLQGSGVFFYLDATQSPRMLSMPAAFSEVGYTCALIPNAGTVVLTAN